MLTYTAAYKFMEEGVHGEVLDFPGAITCGKDVDEARQLLAGALVDMAETNLLLGEKLRVPDASISSADSDLEEPIHLILSASSRFTVVPDVIHEAA
ncbi:MAG: type II toxin-antitoxin system HicB family antitoxin [Pyrinomonadaceae bacterium]